ncbi:MAG: hypothetical protein ASARMPRED_006663 [Alectoria sarmentosa]|nr:MAG: hypothetical protein ASARMPRED_006663 [Alectoria sarmentosa]
METHHTHSNQGKTEFEIKTWEVQLLEEGGYNYVWLVSYTTKYSIPDSVETLSSRKIIIREPKEEASPCQIENEVAFLTYVAKHHPSILVPKVYAYDLKQSGSNSPYIAMKFIDDQPLDSVWFELTESEKASIADEVAQIIVALSETNLGGIGGLTLEHELGPTVEGFKLFKGSDKFHSPAFYDIGPYPSTHVCVVACYDKEICYYTNASAEELDEGLFETTPKEHFIESLRTCRDRLFSDISSFLPQEPFALMHGDFCGRNTTVHDGHISAVIDWEFAGSCPLSELLGGVGGELFELEDDNLLEYRQWSDRIKDGVVEKEVQLARREMIPMDDNADSDEDEDEDEDEDGEG